jgi:hypothetical protein
MQTICSYEWDDVDAGVLCRYLGMGMSGRATHRPRDWSFVRANAYGVYYHGDETDAYDCYVSENDTTNGMCAYASTLQLNGDIPEHEQIRDSSLDFL